jgi:hypothetical protein
MTGRKGLHLVLALTLAQALMVACGGAGGPNGQPSGGSGTIGTSGTSGHGIPGPYELPQGAEPVHLDPADFVTGIDNAYWPMVPGSVWRYTETGEGGVNDVVEDTFDWYAQDVGGNLWYLGEDTTEYRNGKVATTKGSWEAGVDGAQPGIILPANPQVGMAYRQEYLEGQAEDGAEILSTNEKAEVPFGSFDEVLLTKDLTALEPNLVEFKFYAHGVGPILELIVSGGSGRAELVSFSAE